MHPRSDSKHFKPGFLSSLNRSFRIKSSFPERPRRPQDLNPSSRFPDGFFPTPLDEEHDPEENEDLLIGNFRRCHSINVHRKQGLVRIPEMPLKGELLKRVWNDGLDNLTASKEIDGDGSKTPYSEISTPRIDSYRFSKANLEDTQEVDLDAILTQLCALESKCDEEIRRNSYSISMPGSEKSSVLVNNCHQNGIQTLNQIPITLQRTDSPDNDSAFSDTVSMLSSESSTSSSTSAPNKPHLMQINTHSGKDTAFQAKAEKIRLALEKMKKASIKKLFIKAFSVDGSSKSLLVDEKMTCGYVTRLLADKNHVNMEPKWAIVEYLPELQMERIFEDHEILVDNLMLWARESKNKIFFTEKPEKVSMFQTPEQYLISEDERNSQNDYDEHSRSVIIEEFFNNTNNANSQNNNIKPEILTFSNNPVPPMEGPLYMKSDSKKGWKKYHFILRSCGLYYYPKDKTKSKDMTLLASFEVNEIYVGINWKKKYKSPTDFCFALKHPRLQQPKCVKYVKFLCAEDKTSFDKWLVAMRIAKHGRQLLDNYRTLADDLAQEDLDQLANARSCSVISISQNIGTSRLMSVDSSSIDLQNKTMYSEGSITGSSDVSFGRHSCISSSSSSGCMSDAGLSGSEGNAFDSEFSTGTIKRKPCMKPNIPLTTMTRQLKEMVDSASSYNNELSMNGNTNTTCTYTNTGTLTRRNSRRKSIQSNNTDESSGSGTLKRHKLKSNRGSSESMTSCNSSNSSCNTPSKNLSGCDSFISHATCNGGQSPTTCSKITTPRNSIDNQFFEHENKETNPSSGILMGYVVQSTRLPNQESPSTSTTYVDEIDNIQNMPLPPPPSFSNENLKYMDPMFSSTLSLESLPPPPPEMQDLSYCSLSESQLSLTNLPPPPPPLSEMGLDFENIFDSGNNQIVKQDYSPQSVSERIEFYNTANRSTQLVQDAKEKNNKQIQEPIYKPKMKYNTEITASQSQMQNFPIYSNNIGHLKNLTDHNHYSIGGTLNANVHNDNSQLVYNNQTLNNSPQEACTNNFSPNIYHNVNMEQKKIQNQVSSPILLRRHSKAEECTPKENQDVTSPMFRRKQVSFNDSPTISSSQKRKNTVVSLPPTGQETKPQPPRRNENTRLTSPNKLVDSTSNPPMEFLRDLQRVMRKKWQVAQKCKLEPTTTPHEVLGFREYPILNDDYKETSVSNWVQEHYGHTGHSNYYENTNPRQSDYGMSRCSISSSANGSFTQRETDGGSVKKKPPPPIPKRSENTQLTAVSSQRPH